MNILNRFPVCTLEHKNNFFFLSTECNSSAASESGDKQAITKDRQSLLKEIQKQRTEKANARARDIEEKRETVHKVDTKDNYGLGAIVRGLIGKEKFSYDLDVEYRGISQQRMKRNKAENRKGKLRDATLIVPGQYVWIEDETVIVSSTPPAAATTPTSAPSLPNTQQNQVIPVASTPETLVAGPAIIPVVIQTPPQSTTQPPSTPLPAANPSPDGVAPFVLNLPTSTEQVSVSQMTGGKLDSVETREGPPTPEQQKKQLEQALESIKASLQDALAQNPRVPKTPESVLKDEKNTMVNPLKLDLESGKMRFRYIKDQKEAYLPIPLGKNHPLAQAWTQLVEIERAQLKTNNSTLDQLPIGSRILSPINEWWTQEFVPEREKSVQEDGISHLTNEMLIPELSKYDINDSIENPFYLDPADKKIKLKINQKDQLVLFDFNQIRDIEFRYGISREVLINSLNAHKTAILAAAKEKKEAREKNEALNKRLITTVADRIKEEFKDDTFFNDSVDWDDKHLFSVLSGGYIMVKIKQSVFGSRYIIALRHKDYKETKMSASDIKDLLFKQKDKIKTAVESK